MKMCPECRRLSKDDDFCSHCGAAVYDTENYSDISSIDCSNYKEHSHEKQSFSENTYVYSLRSALTGRAAENIPSAKNNNSHYSKSYTNKGSKNSGSHKKGILSWIIWLFIIIAFIANTGEAFWSDFLNMIWEMFGAF